MDRAYLLFEGRILFQGNSEELASNQMVRERYLGRNFVFIRKKFDQPSTSETVAGKPVEIPPHQG